MTSERKIEANRRNAEGSTGPKTATGKARSSKNAFRHGLSIPIIADPNWSEQVLDLAGKIAAATTKADCREIAKRVAAAQLDLVRIRTVRQQLIAKMVNDPDFETVQTKMIKKIVTTGPKLPEPSFTRIMVELNREMAPDEKLARVLAELGGPLAKLERYERRAWSRRKWAVHAFHRALKRHRQAPVI